MIINVVDLHSPILCMLDILTLMFFIWLAIWIVSKNLKLKNNCNQKLKNKNNYVYDSFDSFFKDHEEIKLLIEDNPYFVKEKFCKIKEWKRILTLLFFQSLICMPLYIFTSFKDLNFIEWVYFCLTNSFFLLFFVDHFFDNMEHKKFCKIDIHLCKLGIFNQRFYL